MTAAASTWELNATFPVACGSQLFISHGCELYRRPPHGDNPMMRVRCLRSGDRQSPGPAEIINTLLITAAGRCITHDIMSRLLNINSLSAHNEPLHFLVQRGPFAVRRGGGWEGATGHHSQANSQHTHFDTHWGEILVGNV